MALERKDVRAKLDPDAHRALCEICEIDQVDIGAWVEALVLREVRKRVHEANLLAERTKGLGIVGNRRESTGGGRNDPSI